MFINQDAFNTLLLLIIAGILVVLGLGVAAVVVAVKAFIAGEVVKGACILGAMFLGIGMIFWGRPRNTRLVKEIYDGNAKKVEKLLKRGADPNEYDKKSKVFPLELAIFRGDKEIVGLLLKYKANPDGVVMPQEYKYVDPDKFIPLEAAVLYCNREGDTSILKMLIESGADVNQEFLYLNALDLALDHKCFEAAEVLFEAGIDLNSTENTKGITIMMGLLKDWQNSDFPYFDDLIEQTRWLIERGADIAVKDKNGKIALDYLHEYTVVKKKRLEQRSTNDLEKYRILEKMLTVPKNVSGILEKETPAIKILEKETQVSEIKPEKVTLIAKNVLAEKEDFNAREHKMLNDMTDGW